MHQVRIYSTLKHFLYFSFIQFGVLEQHLQGGLAVIVIDDVSFPNAALQGAPSIGLPLVDLDVGVLQELPHHAGMAPFAGLMEDCC